METGELLAILVLVVFLAIPLILASIAPEKARSIMDGPTPSENQPKPDPDRPKSAA